MRHPRERRLLGVMLLVCALLPTTCNFVGCHCDGPGWHYHLVSVERDGVEVPKTSTKWDDTVVLQSTGCNENTYDPYGVGGIFWLER